MLTDMTYIDMLLYTFGVLALMWLCFFGFIMGFLAVRYIKRTIRSHKSVDRIK